MRGRLTTRIVTLAAVYLGLGLYVSAFRDALIDDAFIQLNYARTLATSGNWGFYADRITNTATSPLNVLLTALAGLVARDMIAAVVWFTALQLTLMLVFFHLTSRALFGSPAFGVLAFVGVAANPLLFSTIGLEGTLFALWLAASVWAFATQRWWALAAALALLTLTRADGFLLFAIVAVVMRAPLRTRVIFACVYVACLIPWHTYSWFQLGSTVPDSMRIKMFQRAWGPNLTFTTGPLMYFDAFPLASALSVALAPFALLLLSRAARANRIVASTGLVLVSYAMLHYLAYSALRVPPYHWYYVSQVVPLAIAGALGLAVWLARTEVPAGRRSVIAATVAAVPVLGLIVVVFAQGVRVREVPIHSNWGTHAAYRDIGLWLKANTPAGTNIFCAAEIGTIAFYADRHLINEFADMNRVSESIVSGKYDNIPVVGRLVRLNYYWRTLQPPLPNPQFLLQGVALDAAKRHESLEAALKTWEVSTNYIEWRSPGQSVTYWIKPVDNLRSDGSRIK